MILNRFYFIYLCAPVAYYCMDAPHRHDQNTENKLHKNTMNYFEQSWKQQLPK